MTISCLFLVGCDKKAFLQPVMSRDNYNTGGNLSFYYDEQAHIAYFGGDGEVVQFYEKDIAKGWTKEGCRVGVTLILPNDLKDYKSATAEIDGKDYISNDFIIEIDENTAIAQFQPIVSEDNKKINIKLTWAEDSQTQEYKIFVKDGTLYMEKQ